MNTPDAALPADYAAAVDDLAERVLDTLRGAPRLRPTTSPGSAAGVGLARRPHSGHDTGPTPGARLAALRVLGADALAGHLLTGTPLDPHDAQAVADSFVLFPAADAGTDGHRTRNGQRYAHYVHAWRDWATSQALAAAGGADLGLAPPVELPAHDRIGESAPPAPGPDEGPAQWRRSTVVAGHLAPLALPFLDGTAHDVIIGRPHDLARGITRSVLRRDHLTAARLLRWLALAHSRGARVNAPGWDTAVLVRHLDLCAAARTRTALQLEIARVLLARSRSTANGVGA